MMTPESRLGRQRRLSCGRPTTLEAASWAQTASESEPMIARSFAALVVQAEPDGVEIEIALKSISRVRARLRAACRLLARKNAADLSKIDVEVLGLEGPVTSKCPFQAGACRPSCPRLGLIAKGAMTGI